MSADTDMVDSEDCQNNTPALTQGRLKRISVIAGGFPQWQEMLRHMMPSPLK